MNLQQNLFLKLFKMFLILEDYFAVQGFCFKLLWTKMFWYNFFLWYSSREVL